MPDDRTQPAQAPGRGSPGIRSGVDGLDEVLGGGFPFNRMILIAGEPGTGKTTLALQFLVAGAQEGERGLYIVLNETTEELRTGAGSYGMSLDGIEVVEMLTPNATGPEASLFQAGEVELSESAERILAHVERVRPRRVVIDSISAVRLLFSDDMQFRHYVSSLKRRLAECATTALLIEVGSGKDALLGTLAYGIVELQQLTREYGRARRRLTVVKMRGTRYLSGYHDFSIGARGLTVHPCFAPVLDSRAPGARELMPSGLPEFDSLLGGGLRRGSSALFLGASGTGKSVVATQFAVAAALRGEPALVFLIDELLANYVDRSRGLGIDIDGALATGRLRIERINAATISPGEFTCKALAAVDRDGVRLIVLDSIGGYMHAVSEEHALVLQMHEILAFLAGRDVLTLLLLTEPDILGRAVTAPVYLSCFSDAIVLFRFLEMQGEIHKCLAVFKKRYGPHESTIRELSIEPGKVSVGAPLRELTGIMTGVPSAAALHHGRK